MEAWVWAGAEKAGEEEEGFGGWRLGYGQGERRRRRAWGGGDLGAGRAAEEGEGFGGV